MKETGSIFPQLKVNLFGDSKLVIKHINNEWELRSTKLKPLFDRAQALVAELEELGCSVYGKWVPRAENKEADSLANQAMDNAASADDYGKEHKNLLHQLGCNWSKGQTRKETKKDSSKWEPHEILGKII